MVRSLGGARRTLLAILADVGSRSAIGWLRPFAALLACVASPAWAAKWDVAPSLTVGGYHSDNVFLVHDPERISNWVTKVSPGISISATGSRARFNVYYAPELIQYARGGYEDQVFHRGSAFGNAELVEQLLFIEASAKVDQYNVSLQGPLSTDNINSTGNRTTVRTAYVSPYLLHDFGAAAHAEARFTRSAWNSDEGTAVLPDNEADRVDLKLASGPAYKLLTWDAGYGRETIKYVTQQESTTEIVVLNARQLLTPTLGLLARAGHETYDSGIPGAVLEGTRWSTGLEWTPTPRTRLAATAGKLFDENSYSLDFLHRTRLSSWSAGYGESVTTSRSEFFVPATASTSASIDQLLVSQFPDPVARQKAVQEFIARTGLPPSLNAPVNFFSDQYFLSKRWQVAASLMGIRNTVLANAFGETRQAQFGGVIQPRSGDFAASKSITLTGAGLLWAWRVTALTTLNTDAGYTRTNLVDIGREDEVTYFRMGMNRQFGPRLSGSIYVRRQHNDSNLSESSYTENAAGATLSMRF